MYQTPSPCPLIGSRSLTRKRHSLEAAQNLEIINEINTASLEDAIAEAKCRITIAVGFCVECQRLFDNWPNLWADDLSPSSSGSEFHSDLDRREVYSLDSLCDDRDPGLNAVSTR